MSLQQCIKLDRAKLCYAEVKAVKRFWLRMTHGLALPGLIINVASALPIDSYTLRLKASRAALSTVTIAAVTTAFSKLCSCFIEAA